MKSSSGLRDDETDVPDNKDAFTNLTEEKSESRQTWSNKIEYILSMVGYLVGLGNLWRFPYICMRNGGGAFLIPFFIFLVIFALPLVFLESLIGQFSGKGFLYVWEVCPLFKGLGWAMLILTLTWSTFYNSILAWTLYFIVKSFVNPLPWTTCNNEWNSEKCVTTIEHIEQACHQPASCTSNSTLFLNMSLNHPQHQTSLNNVVTASEDFWQQNVLEMSSGIENVGHMHWRILLCFIGSWAIVGLCICKGVKSVGKVVYVTALLPYLILTIIFIRSMMLEGSLIGVKKYLQPDFRKLLSVQIWIEAALQLFYSVGPGAGFIISLSSFNKFNNNFVRDSIFITFASEFTSMFSGLVIFSVLGFMSAKLSIPINEIVKSGPGLGFVVYPEALSYLPGQNLWAVLFFIMLLSVGLDSQFVQCESILIGCGDLSRILRNNKIISTAVFCTTLCMAGSILCTQGGIYIYQLLDWYISAFALPVMAFLECIIFSWIYGLETLSMDVNLMLGRGIPFIYRVCLFFITPTILLGLIVSAIIGYQPPTYGSYAYPGYAATIGSVIAFIPLTPIIVCMVREIYKSPGKSMIQKVKNSLKPSPEWKPAQNALAVVDL